MYHAEQLVCKHWQNWPGPCREEFVVISQRKNVYVAFILFRDLEKTNITCLNSDGALQSFFFPPLLHFLLKTLPG